MPPSDVRDSRLPESNQASGTAVAIRPGSYPPGVRGAFTAGRQLVIRDILADTEGIIRWGGDDRRHRGHHPLGRRRPPPLRGALLSRRAPR